jgi:Domain of Unknown Function (DUF1080)
MSPRSVLAALLACSAMASLQADNSGFLGRWNLTGTGDAAGQVYWLEVKEDGGNLSGKFLNRGGSPVALPEIKIEGPELVFRPAAGQGKMGPEHRARLEDGKLIGSTTTAQGAAITWVGVRPPTWKDANANARHAFGKAVDLTSLDAWDVQHKERPSGWTMVDGAMTNEAKANNLVSKQRFQDFRIQAEYKLEKASNSGIYLRGRYELQVLDDFGKPPESHGHMSLYAWVAPKVNASKAPGEWQAMEATIVGNHVTVVLNGQTVHDNVAIPAITGGALDANETEPGPIMLQGDHGKVWFRKVVVTPIAGT